MPDISRFRTFVPVFALMVLFSPQTSNAQETEVLPYSPALNKSYPDMVLWGDLHLHSNLSMDAFTLGNNSVGPDEAYRFAKGELVNSTSGGPAKLSRPLDFLSVTDHAEYLGVMAGLTDEKISEWKVPQSSEPGFFSKFLTKKNIDLKSAITDSPVGKRWHEKEKAGDIRSIMDEFIAAVNHTGEAELMPEHLQQSIWHKVTRIADNHNDPGRFTALIGFEWTTAYEGNNLHRVILYKDSAEKAGRLRPFSTLDSQDPEDLWTFMQKYETETGGNVLAIPHNGNLSNGAMFAETNLIGAPMDTDYAERRAKWEPLYEVTQVKGDAETHPSLSPDDEFADFENWDDSNIGLNEEKTPDMYQYEYGRSALNIGLKLENRLGVNPYKFGMIGSTDSHTGLSTADNNNFFGKFPGSEPTIQRTTNKMAGVLWPNVSITSSGYTAVWAKDNTREEIFDALERKEVYASTGPRISLRVFAGWNFTSQDLYASNFAERGYKKGVPMGGTLTRSSTSEAPIFILRAMRDPLGANLDRVQIIKGWVDDKGETHEKIYNVALSNGRTEAPDGSIDPVGNTVDITTATYSNDVGAAELSAIWTDPEFDENVDAFYYARVLEIPTPRWSTYDAVRFGIDLPQDVPPTLQERAYSSPIWYETDG